MHYSNIICNHSKMLTFGLLLSDICLNHLLAIVISVFLRGYRGKAIDSAEVSKYHRTITAYFLNYSKSNDQVFQGTIKNSVIRIVYQEAKRSSQPIFLRSLHILGPRYRLCIQ